jgi:hypothetical protein
MLEEASFLLFELVECPFCNLFGNAKSIHANKTLDPNVLQKT